MALPINEVVKYSLFYAFLDTLVRGARCVINDMLDCDFGRKLGTYFSPPNIGIERSKGRPIASGDVSILTSVLLAILVAAISYIFPTVTAFTACVSGQELSTREH